MLALFPALPLEVIMPESLGEYTAGTWAGGGNILCV